MLLRFGTSNHRSIREYQEINFTASTLKDSEEGLLSLKHKSDELDNDSILKKIKVLPVIAIYGSNAAGKSTALHALDFYVDAIIHSHLRVAQRKGTPHNPFLLDTHSRNNESSYDSDFVIAGTRYHYGFKLDGERFTSEWLYAFNLHAKRQVRTVLFHRDHTEKDEFYFGPSLKGDNKRFVKSMRANSLYLSVAAQNAHPMLSEIYDYFLNKVSTRLEHDVGKTAMSRQLKKFFTENETNRTQAFDFLKSADIGVGDIEFKPIERDEATLTIMKDFQQLFKKHIDESLDFEEYDSIEARLLHSGEDNIMYPIELSYESSGTLALLQLLGPIFSSLAKGGILIIDELNISLHPIVSREIVKLFSSPKTNTGNAQLFFTTHDTGMLTDGLLRRDQIWFVEKAKTGSTKLFSLSTVKVRGTDNFERGYIEGRFGAAPIFNRFKVHTHADLQSEIIEREK